MTEYKTLPIDKLQPFLIRQLRPDVVEKLTERIRQGFNPARPLTVVPENGHYIVADGNHRLKVLHDLGVKEVPVVIRNEDPYWLGVRCNEDEDTYAPMDLFDWLDVIRALRVKHGQRDIGEKIGWSEDKVSLYARLLDGIPTSIVDLALLYQHGRVGDNPTKVVYQFTERWFRDSGLYNLRPYFQKRLMQSFIGDKCNWRKEKVQSESAKYTKWQEYLATAKRELYQATDRGVVTRLILADTFKSEAQLLQKVKDLNSQAKNKLICGDARLELANLEDGTIDLVITDPPYGIDYKSNFSIYKDYTTRTGIAGDDSLSAALNTLDAVLGILETKTKPDAHVYIFTSWKVYCQTVAVVSSHFVVKNMLVWDKGNWSMGDLEGSLGNQHELVIFATKGHRKVNTRRGDVFSVARVTGNDRHPTEKPSELIRQFLMVSAQKADTVCDPFMGSGSTVKAVKEYGGLNYIGIELDAGIFEKTRSALE